MPVRASGRRRRTVGPGGVSLTPLARAGGRVDEKAASSDAAWIPIAECMKDPICLTPDLAPADASALFLEAGISGAPVVDRHGELLGMVSKTDIARQPRAPTVAELMSTDVDTISHDATLGEAAALMVEKRLRRAPVVTEDNRVVGVVVPLDLLAWVF